MSFKTNPIATRLNLNVGYKNSSFTFNQEMVNWLIIFLVLKYYFKAQGIQLITFFVRKNLSVQRYFLKNNTDNTYLRSLNIVKYLYRKALPFWSAKQLLRKNKYSTKKILLVVKILQTILHKNNIPFNQITNVIKQAMPIYDKSNFVYNIAESKHKTYVNVKTQLNEVLFVNIFRYIIKPKYDYILKKTLLKEQRQWRYKNYWRIKYTSLNRSKRNIIHKYKALRFLKKKYFKKLIRRPVIKLKPRLINKKKKTRHFIPLNKEKRFLKKICRLKIIYRPKKRKRLRIKNRKVIAQYKQWSQKKILSVKRSTARYKLYMHFVNMKKSVLYYLWKHYRLKIPKFIIKEPYLKYRNRKDPFLFIKHNYYKLPRYANQFFFNNMIRIIHLHRTFHNPKILSDYIAKELPKVKNHRQFLKAMRDVLSWSNSIFQTQSINKLKISVSGKLNKSTRTKTYAFNMNINTIAVANLHQTITYDLAHTYPKIGSFGIRVYNQVKTKPILLRWMLKNIEIKYSRMLLKHQQFISSDKLTYYPNKLS